MLNNLEESLSLASNARIDEHERYLTRGLDEFNRRQRRSSIVLADHDNGRPWFWAENPDFDPFSVRRRRKRIAHGLRQSILNGEYECHSPAAIRVGKKDGSFRTVSAFSIPDELVSSNLYKSLLRKNASLFSSNSFAYRPGLVTFDAVQHVTSHWKNKHRLFVAEYDFKKYFDSLNHDYLVSLFDKLGVYRTALEDSLMKKFLTSPMPFDEKEKGAREARRVGIPQGTSISLFLANLALTPLDREFESLGVGFVRYADDTLLWSNNYDLLVRALDKIHNWSMKSCVDINYDKSAGIRILKKSNMEKAELPSTVGVTFLGHELSLLGNDLSEESEAAIYREVDHLIYQNLLKHPLAGTQEITRLKEGIDRDYIVLMSQLRRYMYGNLGESEIRRLLKRTSVPRIALGGKVSLFPSLNPKNTWHRIDGHIRSQIWLALKKRKMLLHDDLTIHGMDNPLFWNASQDQFDSGQVISTKTKTPVKLKLPSAVLMSRLVEKTVQAHGPSVIQNSNALYLSHQ